MANTIPLGQVARIARSARISRSALVAGFRRAIRAILNRQPVPLGVVSCLAVGLTSSGALFATVAGLFAPPFGLRDPDTLVHLSLPPRSVAKWVVDDRARILEMGRGLRENVWFDGYSWYRRTAGRDDQAYLDPRFPNAVVTEVGGEFFRTISVPLDQGRATAVSDIVGTAAPVIIGFEIWKTQFGGDPKIVGKTISPPLAEGRRLEWVVVGIAPKGFSFPVRTNVWLVVPEPRAVLGWSFVARLRRDVRLDTVVALEKDFAVSPLVGAFRPAGSAGVVYLFAGAVGLLMVAWLQIILLLSARTAAGAPEARLRVAIGAPRVALVAEQCGEHLTYIGLGAFSAFAMLPAARSGLVAVLSSVPVVQTAPPMAPGIGLIAALVAAMGAVAAVTSWSHVCSRDLHRGHGARRRRIGKAVTVGQVAIGAATVYLTAVAVENFQLSASVDLGFDVDRTWAIVAPPLEIGPGESGLTLFNAYTARVADALERLRASGAVEDVTSTSFFPMQKGALPVAYVRRSPNAEGIVARTVSVGPGFLTLIRARLSRGQEFGGHPINGLGGRSVAVVTESLARRLFGDADAVGKEVLSGSRSLKVVGVVADVKLSSPDEDVTPTLFSFFDRADLSPNLIVRVRSNIGAGAVRSLVSGVWGEKTGPAVFPLWQLQAHARAEWRSRAIVMSATAMALVVLVTAGVCFSVHNELQARKQEVAIMLAIGAPSEKLHWLLMTRVLKTLAMGSAIGMVLGAVSLKASASLFPFATIRQPAAAAAVFGGVGLLAVGLFRFLSNGLTKISPATVMKS